MLKIPPPIIALFLVISNFFSSKRIDVIHLPNQTLFSILILFIGIFILIIPVSKFVKSKTKWVHLDTYAWSDTNKPGHSKGGDILAVRSIFKFIQNYINNL